MPSQLLNEPNGLDLGQLRIDDAGVEPVSMKERLGFFEAHPMSNAVLLRIEGGANRFGQFGVRSQHQKGFHGEVPPA